MPSRTASAYADSQPALVSNTPKPPDLSNLPLSFVSNTGQTDQQVRFLTRSTSGTVFFTPNEVVLALPSPTLAAINQNNRHGHKDPAYQAQVVTALKQPRTALRLAFVGANPAPTLVGADQLPERTSYLTGDDPAKWQADLASYAGVIYQQLYPGIDLQYDGNNGRLKSTYIVAVGAKPALLRWNYTGAQNVKIDKDGNLAIKLAPPRGRANEDRSVMEHAPVAWQDIAGQRIPSLRPTISQVMAASALRWGSTIRPSP